MPEYLAPGVYVEEVYRSKSIEGVSTTTTGFVGACRYGPIDEVPEILTSLLDFERIYGGRQKLEFKTDASYVDPGASGAGVTANVEDAEPQDNWMWHAVRGFFENGGARLYVKRVFRPIPIPDENGNHPGDDG